MRPSFHIWLLAQILNAVLSVVLMDWRNSLFAIPFAVLMGLPALPLFAMALKKVTSTHLSPKAKLAAVLFALPFITLIVPYSIPLLANIGDQSLPLLVLLHVCSTLLATVFFSTRIA